MPKDEFDFEDPLELNGVSVECAEDTTAAMTECFVEEFLRLGHNHKQILALFRNPHYLGMNLAMEKRGEQFVRDTIAEVFARRGKVVTWPVAAGILPAVEPGFQPGGTAPENTSTSTNCEAGPDGKMPPSTAGRMPAATDPMGAPLPDVTV